MRNLILVALLLASFVNHTRTYASAVTYSFSGVMQGNSIYSENTQFVGSFTYEYPQSFNASGSYLLQSYELTFLGQPLPIPEGSLFSGKGSWNGAYPNNGHGSIGVSNSTEDVFSVTLERLYTMQLQPGLVKLGGPSFIFSDSTGRVFSDTSLPDLSLVGVPFTSGQISISYSIDDGSSAIQTGIISVPEPSSLSLLVLGGVVVMAGRRRNCGNEDS